MLKVGAGALSVLLFRERADVGAQRGPLAALLRLQTHHTHAEDVGLHIQTLISDPGRAPKATARRTVLGVRPLTGQRCDENSSESIQE